MRKRLILFLILFTALGVTIVSMMPNKKESSKEKVKIAACPTCFKLASNIDTTKYEVIPTKSTAESLELLESGHVDMILAGRTLKPNEPKYNSILISDGYSFLSSKSMAFNVKDLDSFTIYTDIDPNKIKSLFNVDKVIQVKDVYEHISDGIIVTSWENTDYTRAEMVHLLDDTGERVALSRRPTLYCPTICGNDATEIANLINSNNFKVGGESL